MQNNSETKWYIYVLNYTEGTIHKVETTYQEIIHCGIEDIVGFSLDNCEWMTGTKNYLIKEIKN